MSMDLHLQNPNPSNSNPIPSLRLTSSYHDSDNPTTPAAAPPPTATAPVPFKESLRRPCSPSELTIQVPEKSIDPIQGLSSNDNEFDPQEDCFSTYIDVKMLGVGGFIEGYEESVGGGGGEVETKDSLGNEGGTSNRGRQRGRGRRRCDGEGDGEKEKGKNVKHRHQRSTSMKDGNEIVESKKAMPPDKLAELWALDPKRAKRIVANRLSAARSKERKVLYILELERKVQNLQTQATTLAAQVSLYQRDITGLAAENAELKRQLQSIEHQAGVQNAMNQALKQEIERLKLATGEKMTAAAPPVCVGYHRKQPYDPLSPPSADPQSSQSTVAFGSHNVQLPPLTEPGMPPPSQLRPLSRRAVAEFVEELSEPLARS